MAALDADYGQYLQWLRLREATPGARKVAKIVGANLGAIAHLGTASGQRAIRLSPILREAIEATEPDIAEQTVTPAGAGAPWSRVTDIEVGPFRGFRFGITIPFPKRFTLVYGPNGCGKTSLCEALELALLGEVEEATAKRADASLESYLKNTHEDKLVRPVLRGQMARNRHEPVVPDADLYRFCFIEKNRIDDFARLSARTAAKADALIALLFGLKSFDEFVRGFTKELRLEVSTVKKDEWEARQQSIQAARGIVEAIPKEMALIPKERKELADEYREGSQFDDLLVALGKNEKNGRLQELEAQLRVPLAPLIGVSVTKLRQIVKPLVSVDAKIQATKDALAEKASQVSFRDLYRAVVAVAKVSPEACPACDTPLSMTRTNPFKKADAGLLALEELASIEANQQQFKGDRTSWRRQLLELSRNAVQSVADRFVANVKVGAAAQSIRHFLGVLDPSSDDWDVAIADRQMALKLWRDLLVLAKRAETADREVSRRHNYIGAQRAERDRLLIFNRRVEDSFVKVELLKEQLRKAKQEIAEFDEQNVALKEAVAAELTATVREVNLQQSYDEFLQQINAFRDELPQTLVAGLNETAKDLYNSFNADDPEGDRLADLSLPTKGGDPILIQFNGRKGQFDALHILSEGHVRCLGLAILLAKNVKLGLPLVIFDDVVNAIDHDHRGAIRDTLISNTHFAGKQIIMTCHSNEFIKDVQNHAGQNHSELIVMKHHAGDYQPKVMTGACRAYLDRAEARLEELDHRAALANGRQALEYLAQKVWKLLAKVHVGDITLRLLGPGKDPDLRNVIDQLREKVASNLTNGTLQPAKWQPVLDAFVLMTGIGQNNHAWLYLNKGTHDEFGRDDFEEAAVRTIVGSLRAMDTALA